MTSVDYALASVSLCRCIHALLLERRHSNVICVDCALLNIVNVQG